MHTPHKTKNERSWEADQQSEVQGDKKEPRVNEQFEIKSHNLQKKMWGKGDERKKYRITSRGSSEDLQASVDAL